MSKKREKIKVHISGIVLDVSTKIRLVSFYWFEGTEQWKATIPVNPTEDVWEVISKHIDSEPFAAVGQEREV